MQSDTSTAFKLLGYIVRARTALSLIFSSCLSKAHSKAVQFSHKRLYSVFNIARTAYTNRHVLIIWKHLFENISLLKPRLNKTHVCKTWLFYKKVHCRSESV